MNRDIRSASTYREAQTLLAALTHPGAGEVSDASDLDVSPDGTFVVFTGTLMQSLDAPASTRLCLLELRSGALRVITAGSGSDRAPKFSPDGRHIAFLSDRHRTADFQLYLLEISSGAARATPRVSGWVEYLHWSHDGTRILLGVAGHGASLSSGQGATGSAPADTTLPEWTPQIEVGREDFLWRRAWSYDCEADHVRPVTSMRENIWEAIWCNPGSLAAVVSEGPDEGSWYSADLRMIDVSSGESRILYTPSAQVAWPAVSPSGGALAFIEGVGSDRGIVAGDVRIIDVHSGQIRSLQAAAIDVSCIQWLSEEQLLLAGQRGLDTVVAVCEPRISRCVQTWSSSTLTSRGFCVRVSALNSRGDCVLLGEGFLRAPELGVIESGDYRCVRSFQLGEEDLITGGCAVEPVEWTAPDGLAIQGWLLRRAGTAPQPVLMCVHGGPVGHWRPLWLGRALHYLMLMRRGCALFLPNPRGSSGRGQDFARRVLGDVGGADAQDLLSGLDALVARNLADPHRLGVMGVSYGGFMAAWLVTQDTRFGAAAAVAPATNHVSCHLTCNIPQFVSRFVGDNYRMPEGRYFHRSPIMHAHRARTPMLNICGALDRCTPPEEARQFHNALLEQGVRSVLVTYPKEGHGIRGLPAMLDYAARVTDWFSEHLCATSPH